MKKIAVSVIAAVLLLTLVCGSAFALTGDITIKAAKAYSDPELKTYIGTIPKYTSVMVRAYGTYADVVINGVECYVKPSTLSQGKFVNKALGTATLVKSAKVYQRPSSSARVSTNKKARKVHVYAVKNGFALIRNSKGVYGFVSTSDLNDLKS